MTEEQKSELPLLDLPRECYKYKDFESQIVGESSDSETRSEVIGKIWGKVTGFLVKDAMFPYKVVLKPEILALTNIVKSFIMESLKTFGILIFLVKREKLIDAFNKLGFRVIHPYILKDEFMSVFGRELQFFIFRFVNASGIPEDKAYRTAEIVSHIIEYDNAYRLRLVDILSETNKELLKNPSKEVRRLLKIIISREKSISGENVVVIKKMKIVGLLFYLIFKIPKYKKALKTALSEVDFINLQYDESDLYWTAFRTDYMFWGKTKSERKRYVDNRGWTYPENVWQDIKNVV